jgi:Lon protease-like protein
MADDIFPQGLDNLPEIIPIFPLPSALLLPDGHLPLNIFEPRYMAMVRAALASPMRLIGMVQPTEDNSNIDPQSQPVPGLFSIGCAGRITYFQETDDQRYLIALTGLCRFRLVNQQLQEAGFRNAQIDWTEFQGDLRGDTSDIDRQPLITVMKQYFKLKGFDADWAQIEQSDDDQLLATLSMVCPFDVAEKQALLEANDTATRADLLIAMMEMALHDENGGQDARH